jgi:hypothetical protein
MIQCLLFSIKICLFYVGQMTSRFFIKCVKYYIQIMGVDALMHIEAKK